MGRLFLSINRADDYVHSKRPFTISLTEESSPAKKINLRYLLA